MQVGNLVFLLLAALWGVSAGTGTGTSAQTVTALVGDSTARAKIDALAVSTWFCSTITLSPPIIVGYWPGTNKAVYKTGCSGHCLATRLKPTSCQPTYKTVTLAAYAFGYSSSAVRVVESCGCKPRPCEVTDSVSGTTSLYPHGAVAYDSCNQKCTCSYGRLVNCCRQRKEFRTGMSATERERYIQAVLIASTTAPFKTQYDALVQLHATHFGAGIHGGPRFFPWHRWYILQMENVLRQVDCRVTVPWWDWSKEAASPFASSIWGSGPDDLGGTGVGPSFCVTTGPFATPGWSTTLGGCLTRNFAMGATFATPADLQGHITSFPNPTAADFASYSAAIEAGPGTHNSVHCAVGGIMCTLNAANDPIFFAHHDFLDKLWADWQSQSVAHVTAYSGAPNAPMPGAGAATPAHVFDLNAQYDAATGTTVSVCYVKPPRFLWLDSILASLSTAALAAIPRTPVVTSLPWLMVMAREMPMDMPNATIAMLLHAEDVRNGVPGAATPPPPFALMSRSAVAKCNCHSAFLGIALDDAALAPFDGTLIAPGCDTEDPSAGPPEAPSLECTDSP